MSTVHHKYPAPFRGLVELLLFTKPQPGCPLSWMSDDVLFYILNMYVLIFVPGHV